MGVLKALVRQRTLEKLQEEHSGAIILEVGVQPGQQQQQ